MLLFACHRNEWERQFPEAMAISKTLQQARPKKSRVIERDKPEVNLDAYEKRSRK